MVPVVSLVGYSDSGKTTVMQNLIRILKQRGYRIAAVKHASHGYTMDSDGTDSWNYAQAGADKVIIAGPQSLTIHELLQQEMPLAEIVNRIGNIDMILAEGFKKEPGPKIEIFRQGISENRITGIDNLVATISDIELPEELPHFSFEELDKVADFIVQRFL